MDIVALVTALGGVAHRNDLTAAGLTQYRIVEAIRAGAVHAIARSWIALEDADRIAVLAAQLGGRIACTSAARALGLWTLADETPHIWVPPKSRHPRIEGVRLHRSIPLAPALRHGGAESLIDVLSHVAVCLPFEAAIATWESAIRKGLILPAALVAIPWRSIAAQTLASAAGVLADSGLESIVVDRLRRMGLVVRQQVRLFGHPVDILIGERLVIQLDGFSFHSKPSDRDRDNRHDARLRAAGYHIIRIGYAEVVAGWAAIEAEIVLAIAQRAHVAVVSPALDWAGR